MPRTYRSKLELSDEEKKNRRREQKKMSMRRARKKLNETAKEEIRKMDRERYHRKKERGEIKTIDQYTPRKQRQIRKMWREKSRKRRELLKMRKATANFLENNTPPSSPSSSFSRVEAGRVIAARNKNKMKAENETLKIKVLESLSCLSYPVQTICPHLEIGQKTIPQDRALLNSTQSSVSHDGALSPRSIATSEADTESFRSDFITSEEEISQSLPVRPKKRLRVISDSDESDIVFPLSVSRKRTILFTDSKDEDSIF